MQSSDHEFGGVSTGLKLSVVDDYLRAFTTAPREKFKDLWCIDAFAGTGERTVRHPAQPAGLFDPETKERIERLRGSAQIAIDVDPRFDHLVFVDSNKRRCKALRALHANNPAKGDIEVLEDDANEAIGRLLNGRSWNAARAVMFLHPYGMKINWTTLEAIRATRAIDVWYLVSLSGLFRQAALDNDALDQSKRLALTRMLVLRL